MNKFCGEVIKIMAMMTLKIVMGGTAFCTLLSLATIVIIYYNGEHG